MTGLHGGALGAEGDREEPPAVFKRGSIKYWAPLGVLAVLAAIWNHEHWIMLDTKEGAAGLMLTSAEILTVMFTVTLGITLIGLQFRTQSYSREGLIEYIKDKVVYMFIILVIGSTMLNLVGVAMIGDGNFKILAAASIICTFASMCYHAGYIYHVIYKLQYSQIFRDVYKKIDSAKFDMGGDGGHGSTTRFRGITYEVDMEPFKIWEDMMIRLDGVKDNDLFSRELGRMLEIADRARDAASGGERDARINTIFGSINRVVLFHTNQHNRNFIKTILDRLGENPAYLEISMDHGDSNESRGDWGYDLWDCMWRIMTVSTITNNGITFGLCTSITMSVLNSMLSKTPGGAVGATDLSTRMYTEVIETCVEHDRYRLMRTFMGILSGSGLCGAGHGWESAGRWWAGMEGALKLVLASTAAHDDRHSSANMPVIGSVLEIITGTYKRARDTGDADQLEYARRLRESCFGLMGYTVEYCMEHGHNGFMRGILGRILEREASDAGIMDDPDLRGGFGNIVEEISRYAGECGADVRERYINVVRKSGGSGPLRTKCMEMLDAGQ
ncbi:MAG: hypothetical protein MPK31_06600 [Gammaproteobacteria bacterium]|nr:hypothetical protein [Gammaproteobacteria bacterium]MDA7990414.1 hypothetical protein [Gammaproteobacteria bacterium]